MVKKFFVIVFLFVLLGCATTQGQSPMTQLQLRVGELERQLDDKDDQIQSLNYEIRTLSSEIDRLNKRVRDQGMPEKEVLLKQNAGTLSADKEIIRVSASPQDVQKALQKSGHYQGAIDGKIGAKTQKAIEDFQKSQGLNVDGIVGAKTWNELKEYLE